LSALGLTVVLLLAADAAAQAPAGVQAPAADAPTVAARVDRSEVHVGDIIQLTVVSVGPRETPVNLPRSLELAPFAELDEQNRKVEERDLGDGKMRREFTLYIAGYEPGEVTLPGLEVTYLGKRGEVLSTRTESIPIKIASLIANEPEPALKDNAPPVRVLERDLLLVYIGGAIAAAALGGLLATAVRRRMRARASLRPPPPPRPPHDIALERLDRLGAAGFGDGIDHRPFYFLLSEVIREYLGARFGFDSLELTTAELMDELRRRAARELVMGEIEGWLSGCDLVKFAKVSPTATEARGALEMAIRIVESTRPRPEPQAVVSGPPDAPGKESVHA
jgi:hypothetical protein